MLEVGGCVKAGALSAEMVEDESDMSKSCGNGRFLLASFSAISSSIVVKVSLANPLRALKLANARQSWRFRATFEVTLAEDSAKIRRDRQHTFAISILLMTFSAT